MSDKVSVSQTGQNQPPPSRAQRDAASSSEGGRKAVEEPLKKSPVKKQRIQEPIGLELETAGDKEDN